MDEKEIIARELYRHMPGAEMPPAEEGLLMWGEVEHTPHWRFCEVLAKTMLDIVLRAAEVTAAATVRRMREEAEQAKAETLPSAEDWADDFDPENLADMVDDAAEAVLDREP